MSGLVERGDPGKRAPELLSRASAALRGAADSLGQSETIIAQQHVRIEALEAENARLEAMAKGMARDLSKRPCETIGAEDMEAGCCGPCRARTFLATLNGCSDA